MNKADLVGIHEARIAHHVAAVREVDRENRAAAVLYRARAVVVELLVVVGPDVAAGEALLQMAEERRVDGHYVFEVAVLRAILNHQDLAITLDNLGLDFTDLLVQKDLVRQLAVNDLLANLGYATWTQGVRFARPTERRLRLFPGLEQRLLRPLGRE